jgi:alpha-glucosidase
MVWKNSNQNGGFSDAKPWLPVSPDHLGKTVQHQEDDPESTLNHYRRLTAFRSQHPVFANGEQIDMQAQGDTLCFVRTNLNETVFCAFNLSQTPTEISLPAGTWTQIGAEIGEATCANGKITLGPWQSAFTRKEG